MKSQFGVTSLFLMKSAFSQNQIFYKKRNSYINFLLVFCLKPFVADTTFITLLLSQIYACTTSYWLLNIPGRKWWHHQNSCYKCCKTNVPCWFLSSFLQIERILNKLERAIHWLPPTQPIWPQKKPTFARSLNLTSLDLSWIKHNFHIFRLRIFLKMSF